MDARIAVGYRVNSKEATRFRIWATSVLKEYIKKGFVLTKDHMELTTWKQSPDGRILKSDTIVAKNYLQLDMIRKLERLVSGYFDYIEDIVERENTFTMKEFAESVNEFINFRKHDILRDKGKVTREEANKKAYTEYDIFNKTQKLDSDFDKFIKENNLNNDSNSGNSKEFH